MKENAAVEMMTQNQFVDHVIETYRSGRNRFCFILGAGASVESGVPTGTALEMRWMNCLMGEKDDGLTPKKKPEETRALAKRLHEAKQISHPFDRIEKAWKKASKNGTSMPSEYYFDIYSLRFHYDRTEGYWYLEREMEKCRPSVGYHTLALLLTKNNQHNLVITTNFDSLVEDALFLYTNKKPMVAGHESLADYIDPNIQRPIVAKVHRSLFYDPINASDDTLDEKWEIALQSFFASYTPVVIGYGGGDRSLMSFLEKGTTRMRHGLYWCCRNGEDPGEKVKKLVADKGGHLVSIPGFDALMIEIGMALFKEEILPAATARFFDRRSSDRMKEYGDQWDKWRKENDETNPEIVSDMDRAETEEQEKREEQNQMTAQDYYRRARKNSSLGNYNEAIEDFTKAIEMKPDYEWAYVSRSDAYYRLGQYDKVIADCNMAIKLDPDDAIAYNNRGAAYNGLGQNDKALADCNKAIELKQDDAMAYNNRGISYNELGQNDRAIADFNKALEFDPDYVFAYNNRGNAYSALGQNDKAIADYNKAIELNPNYAEAYNNRGNAYSDLGQNDKAIADYNKAIKLKPEYALAYNNRGYVYYELGQNDKAIADYNKAIKLKPDDARAYNNRADVYEKLGQKELAEADRAKAAELEAKEKE